MKKAPVEDRKDLTYAGYLGLDRILNSQDLLSKPAAHDEMLFIIVHQCFELWFKQMLHELDLLLAMLPSGETHRSIRSFHRLLEILRVFDAQLRILETMSPAEFLKFRDRLNPASGFQSWQFREVEFVCGLRDERYLKIFEKDAAKTERLRSRLEGPTLWDAFCRLLKQHGYPITGEEEQRQSIVDLYRGNRNGDLLALCEVMIEFDEQFSLWREHHVRMAERMIGSKPGTGKKHVETYSGQSGSMGEMGVDYLRSTLPKRFFPVLWAARSGM